LQGAATRRTAAAVGGTEGKPQAEDVLHDTGEIYRFPVTLTRQRVVESPTPTKWIATSYYRNRGRIISAPTRFNICQSLHFAGEQSSPLWCTSCNCSANPNYPKQIKGALQ